MAWSATFVPLLSSPVKKQRTRKPKTRGGENAAVSKKRKLMEHQLAELELQFADQPKLETERKERIAAELGWFQNQRARWMCKKLEDAFVNFTNSLQNVLAQEVHLEAQLTEKLQGAESEIQRLSARFEGCWSGGDQNETPTPTSSSLSIDQGNIIRLRSIRLWNVSNGGHAHDGKSVCSDG